MREAGERLSIQLTISSAKRFVMHTTKTRRLTIDSEGRIALPSDVRRRLSLRAGSKLRLSVESGRVLLTPESVLGMSATKRVVLRPSGRTFDAAAATRADRHAQARRRGR